MKTSFSNHYETMESVSNGLKTVERASWLTAAGSFAIDLFTTLDTSSLTGIALATGITSWGLRKLFSGSVTHSSSKE